MGNDHHQSSYRELAEALHQHCQKPAIREWVIGCLTARLSTVELVDLVEACDILADSTPSSLVALFHRYPRDGVVTAFAHKDETEEAHQTRLRGLQGR